MNAAQLELLREVRATLADICDTGECDPETLGALELARLRLAELPGLGDDNNDDRDDDSGTFEVADA